MRMKKIIAWLTAIGLALQCFGTVLADVDNVPIPDRLKTESEYALGETVSMGEYAGIFKILTYLNIFDEDMKNTEVEKNVERGFAAQSFARMLSPEHMPTDMKSIADVSATAKYAEGIYSAKSLGIIQDEDKFYPTRPVTVGEAMEMAMRTLGYDYLTGVYSLQAKAKEIGLYKQIDATAESMTMGQFMYLLINVLESSVAEMETLAVNGEDFQLKMSDNSAVFIERKNIVLRKGIVTAQGNTSLFGDSSLKEDEIEINRLRYKTVSPAEDLLGKSVYAYIDTEKDDIIISVWEISNKNTVVEIPGDSITKVSASQITYVSSDDDNEKASVSSAAKVIYNNQYYGTMAEAVSAGLLGGAARVILKDNDGDDSADVVQVEKIKYAVVNSVSKISGIISLMYNEGRIDAEKNKNSFSLYMDGEKTDISVLAKWDVLSVLEATRNDGSINYSIKASRKTVTGILESTDITDSEYNLKIDGKNYIAAPEYEKYVYLNKTVQKPEIGLKSVFRLSDDGKIVTVAAESECEFAYVMEAGRENDINGTVGMKVFTTDGKFKTLLLSEDTKLFSSEYPKGTKLTMDEMYKKVSTNGKPSSNVIGFTADSEGGVSELYLEQNQISAEPGMTDYPVNKNYTAGGTGSDREEARLYASIIGGKYMINKSVPVIIVPEESQRTNEDLYAARNTNSYSSDHYFSNETITLYNVDRFYTVGFAIVQGGFVKSVDEYITPFMISKITHGVENDEEVLKLHYYSGDKETSVNVLKTADLIENTAESNWQGTLGITLDDLKVGDIVQLETDNSGLGNMVRVLFKMNNKGGYRVQTKNSAEVQAVGKNASTSSKIAIIYSKVIDVEGNRAIVNVSDSGTDTAYSYPVFFTGIYGKSTFTLYDSETKKVYQATMSEIQPGDELIIRKRWNEACDGFIIR